MEFPLLHVCTGAGGGGASLESLREAAKMQIPERHPHFLYQTLRGGIWERLPRRFCTLQCESSSLGDGC